MSLARRSVTENARLRTLLEAARAAWAEPFLMGREVNGGDLVEWFGPWLARVNAELAEPPDTPEHRAEATGRPRGQW